MLGGDKDKNSPTFTPAPTQSGLNSELNPSEVFQREGRKKKSTHEKFQRGDKVTAACLIEVTLGSD